MQTYSHNHQPLPDAINVAGADWSGREPAIQKGLNVRPMWRAEVNYGQNVWERDDEGTYVIENRYSQALDVHHIEGHNAGDAFLMHLENLKDERGNDTEVRMALLDSEAWELKVDPRFADYCVTNLETGKQAYFAHTSREPTSIFIDGTEVKQTGDWKGVDRALAQSPRSASRKYELAR